MTEQSANYEKSFVIPRPMDGSALILHYNGGFRAAEIDKDVWKIEPILEGGKPCIKGNLSKAQLSAFTIKNKFFAIAFENMGWTGGSYHSSWPPINPNRSNHFLGPADIWRNISSNITRGRTDEDLRNLVQPTHEKIAAILDNKTEAERLASRLVLA